MGSNVFSSLEIDAIGEILNISLGASATAVSTLLSRRVDITIPVVQVSSKEEFEFASMEPAVGVEIVYVSGLNGKNVMLLKRHDVKVIVEILMGTEIPDEEFELNDLYMSAVCEVMNQMMGASSTALSEFLGEIVNISTPESFEINTISDFKEKYLGDEDQMVVVSFSLNIEDAVESEFLNVMTLDLARKLLACVGLGQGQSEEDAKIVIPNTSESDNNGEEASQEAVGIMSQEQIEKALNGGGTPEPPKSSGGTLSQAEIENLLNGGASAPEPPKTSGGTLSQAEIENLLNGGASAPEPPKPSGGTMSQEEIEKLLNGGAAPQQQQTVYQQPVYQQPMYQQPVYQQPPQPQPNVFNVKPFAQEPSVNLANQERPENLDMLMDVALEVSVEIGRTKKYVKEILEYSQGSLVVLDTLAGDQVDVFVNGQCIAKGDVVVVDDCFGVRITEILNKN
ncbi:MAG: flagellar motor switch protein FliN [Lachnospiraceae bacterium]|nr:flagellar motor switch protein FliN [Lachnospiraceae bacterium]